MRLKFLKRRTGQLREAEGRGAEDVEQSSRPSEDEEVGAEFRRGARVLREGDVSPHGRFPPVLLVGSHRSCHLGNDPRQ